ncbi:ArsR family transcriptional regulator [Microbacterium mangrovi]|uniref:ArsR family transcriptional regulator n=1 Tax=Microbacterium mangrovi TaxID=1348253 RepID=A0A0B2ADP8_9MICO|nr:metalloregulator ArsR/SmtB family transcription factor [Microbacterium mangrovi]KHK99957.1 ArsR family transcriptional regulator [Microbacterium mangrovi]
MSDVERKPPDAVEQGRADPDDRVFKALAAPVRRRMLDALKEQPLTTGALCARFPEIDRTTALQHLRVLEAAELVSGRKVGRERVLTLSPVPIKRIHDRWIGDYARAAVDLLARLDARGAEEVGRE